MTKYFNNIELTALAFLAYFAFSLSGGPGNSLVAGFPSPSISTQPAHHNIRHHKHRKMFLTWDLPPVRCPNNKVRGHDGDCYRAFSLSRSRRSPVNMPDINPCGSNSKVQGQDGGCYRRFQLGRRRRSIANVPKIDPCQPGSTRNHWGECSRIVNRLRRSLAFSATKESNIQPVSCPPGYLMNGDGFCLISDPIESKDLSDVPSGKHDSDDINIVKIDQQHTESII